MTTQPGLLCPVCRVDLVMAERQNVEIDYCPKCRGVWLDRGELDKIIDKSLAAETQPAEFDRGSGAHGASGHSGHHGSSHGRHGGHGRGLLGRLFD
jgi:Zn-finger nucleic acid-binding protein